VLGRESDDIARAFLAAQGSMSKRLMRDKRKIRDAGVSFRLPDTEDLPQRLTAVMEAIYGAFSRDWLGAGDLAEEAFYLASLLAEMLPDEPEVLGLAALIAYTLSREAARVQGGRFVPLDAQDTSLWDSDLLRVAQGFLTRAHAKGGLGRFQLEAAIQAVHADRKSTGVTDWDALLQLHLGLSRVAPTIGATVGYAAAVGKAVRAKQGLDVLYSIDEKTRAAFAPAEATRAYLLAALGHGQAAAAAYDQAIDLDIEPPLREFLKAKRAELGTTLV